MKQYVFETLFGHPELKRFVYDYYAALVQARQVDKSPSQKANRDLEVTI